MSGGLAYTVKEMKSNRYLIDGVVGRFLKVKRVKQSGQSRLVVVLEENNEIC
tara:strand:+ start:616 stop:771 length:156 start_codon:yes stop_codon:yes gene_type:complete